MPKQVKEAILTLHNVLPVYRDGKVRKYVTVLSLAQIADAVTSGKVVVDYDYQRGVKILRRKGGERRIPMVDSRRVTDMFYKIIQGDFYGGALTWNLRDSTVKFQYDESSGTLHILSGTPTIPDSNHRHQACIEVMKAYMMGKLGVFDPHEYDFPLVIEHLRLEEEAGLFYEYNQLAKPASSTRAKFLHQVEPANHLTGLVIQETFLKDHVEVIMNSIGKNSTMIVTFNALSTAIEQAYGSDLTELSDDEFHAERVWLTSFVNELGKIRPELQPCSLTRRQKTREELISDSALAFSSYIRLSRRLRRVPGWKSILSGLAGEYVHRDKKGVQVWRGDFFSRKNPLWLNGVIFVKENQKTGAEQLSLQNSRASKEHLWNSILAHLGLD